MRNFPPAIRALAAALALGPIAHASGEAQERRAAARAAAPTTLQEARQILAARVHGDGWWVASNAVYADAPGESESYSMRYRAVPGGQAITGCLWGETGGAVDGPFWYFYAAWDPVERAILVYQSSPGGAVAIGHQRPGPAGVGETEQTLERPGQPAIRVRHTSEFPHPDTLVDRSFEEGPEGWQARRSYEWIWTPPGGREAPC